MFATHRLAYYGPASLHPLVSQVQQLAEARTAPVVVALDGRSGAGKSTLAADLAKQLSETGCEVTLFQLEDLYQGWHGLAQAANEWARIAAELRERGEATWTSWDWEKSKPLPGRVARVTHRPQPPASVVVGEGVGAFAAEADLRCWVHRPDAARKSAALARDGETYAPYWDVWAAQEVALMNHNPRYESADFIFTPADETGTP